MYHYLQPGGKWVGEYAVIPLARFAGLDLSANARHEGMYVQRTKEVRLLTATYEFPLQDEYRRANESLEGVSRSAGFSVPRTFAIS